MVQPRIMKITKIILGIHLMISQNFAVFGCVIFEYIEYRQTTYSLNDEDVAKGLSWLFVLVDLCPVIAAGWFLSNMSLYTSIGNLLSEVSDVLLLYFSRPSSLFCELRQLCTKHKYRSKQLAM